VKPIAVMTSATVQHFGLVVWSSQRSCAEKLQEDQRYSTAKTGATVRLFGFVIWSSRRRFVAPHEDLGRCPQVKRMVCQLDLPLLDGTISFETVGNRVVGHAHPDGPDTEEEAIPN